MSKYPVHAKVKQLEVIITYTKNALCIHSHAAWLRAGAVIRNRAPENVKLLVEQAMTHATMLQNLPLPHHRYISATPVCVRSGFKPRKKLATRTDLRSLKLQTTK